MRSGGMSRTSLAVRFKSVVGKAPLTYLLGWRMQLAARDLRRGIRDIPMDMTMEDLRRRRGTDAEHIW